MRTAIKNKNLESAVVFSAIVLALAFISPLLGGSPNKPGLGFVLWGTAPALVAIILRTKNKDWIDAGLKPFFRMNKRIYMLVILTVPVLMLSNMVFGLLTTAASISEFSMTQYLKMVLPGLIVFFFFAVFEEFGWRGYLVPKLASSGVNDFMSYALISFVWATWHMPYICDLAWVYDGANMTIFIPLFYLSMFAYSILYFEITFATKSVWPAVVLHSLTNAIQHPMAADFLKIEPGMEFLVSFTGLFMIVIVSLSGLALRQVRKRKDIVVSKRLKSVSST